MDKIVLTELKMETVIGIWEWEKRNPQTILIDLEMQTDIKKASETDSIEDALDYKAITKRIKNFTQNNTFELIETLAEKLSQVILHEFNVSWLRLSVSKPFAIRDSKNVGLIIERTSR
ncbi:MAG: dihydroneopterin aldolase [Gammaproteobacteria bacterium]|jgi:dihydroneopterin aldolase|nr:dihydroneopterin aldolase [Gammaproteobacteria bacterium]MBT7753317.1 dihydroneopterin aldolase [Gammaproteobacteria bacterium]